MPITPDRAAGPSDEEELQLEDRTGDGDPTVDGAVRFVDDILRIKTSAGVRELGDALKILGKALDGAVGNNKILRYLTSSGTWKVQALGDGATIANIMQFGISIRNVSLDDVYTSVTPFVYGGSDNWGTLFEILVLTAQTGGAGKYHDVRIYDATNGNVIAELTGSSNTVPTVINLGTISNVPTDPATFEVQVRRTGSGHNLDVYSISMRGE